VYNIALNARTTLNDLFTNLRSVLAESHVAYSRRPIHAEPRVGDVRHSQADISKASRLLGYKPTHDVIQGLRATVPWYQRHSIES
jgi:UDP-N-acetylglucosamine 4-epimerase